MAFTNLKFIIVRIIQSDAIWECHPKTHAIWECKPRHMQFGSTNFRYIIFKGKPKLIMQFDSASQTFACRYAKMHNIKFVQFSTIHN